MKPIRLLGDSLERLREFPEEARQDAGYQLDKVQRGLMPDDFKPMPSIGKGVEEIRVRDESDAYRVIYTARRREAVYVLHAFQKKTQTTLKRDVMWRRHVSRSWPKVDDEEARKLCERLGRDRRYA